MSDSPSSAVSSSTSTITFTYTADSCGLLAGGELQLDVPPGWPAPLTGLVSSGGTAAVSGGQITITGATLPPGGSLIIRYPTVTPSLPGPSTFVALEQAGTGGILAQLASSPQFTVLPGSSSGGSGTPSGGKSPRPADAGTMTVSPASVTAGRRTTLRFTYTPPGSWPGGTVRIVLAMPRGWTPPTVRPRKPGSVSTSPDPVTVSRMRIIATASLKPGQRLIITYDDAVVPAATGRVTFSARVRRSGGGNAVTLAPPPSVVVTSLAALSSGGGFRFPVALLAGVLAAACAVALGLGVRLLRLRARRVSATKVSTVGHPGPPGAVTVHPTTNEPALVVRAEPHPGAVSVRTEQVTR